MAMPGRNSHAGQGSYSSSTTVVSGISYPTDLVITDRCNATPPEYKAATSIEFVGEYVDNGNDTYIAYIVDGSNPDPNPLSGGGATSGDAYRYGFNGKENDKDIIEGGIAFEARIYDDRLGRFLSRDPKERSYAWQTTYAYYKNSPIRVPDILGAGGDDPPEKKKGLIYRIGQFFKSLFSSPVDKTVDRSQEQQVFNTAINNSVETMQPAVEAVDKAKAVMQSFVPGADSYYELKEGNYGAAVLYGLVDICGGSIEKGVEKVIAKEIAESSFKVCGKEIKGLLENPLNHSFKSSFASGEYKMMEATEDMIVYRFSGGKSLAEGGEFFSMTSANNATEANKMLNIWNWGNTGEQVTPTIIKKGTQFAFGSVEGGWGYQVFIPTILQAGNVVRQIENTKTIASGNLLQFIIK